MFYPFPGMQPHSLVVDENEGSRPLDDGAWLGEVEGHCGMSSRRVYSQMSSSVRFDSGTTPMFSPFWIRPL